jgi:3-hydroxyisobutyrate dehydrogenase-like beta-hydroxyacid dehydrogenase
MPLGEDMNIGWVGLGMIGTAMVKQLLASEYPVTAYERGKGLESVIAAGAGATGSYQELAAGCDLCVLCVFSDAQVREIVFGQGLLAALRPGSVLAIHTTGSPLLAREIAAAAPAGIEVLDATFSGGPHDIAQSALTLMVGGSEAALSVARPVFETYARSINHVGGVGSGQIVKLLNNLIFATNLMNAMVVLRMLEDQGFDSSEMANIFHSCSGGSYAMDRFRSNASVDVLVQTVRPYLEKDVASAMRAAADAGLDTSLFNATAEFFRPGAAS